MNLFNCLYISLMLLLVILFLQLLYLCILSSYHFSIFWEPTGIVILLLFLYFSQVLLSSDCNSIAVYRRISCPVQSSFLTIYLLSFFITCFVFFFVCVYPICQFKSLSKFIFEICLNRLCCKLIPIILFGHVCQIGMWLLLRLFICNAKAKVFEIGGWWILSVSLPCYVFTQKLDICTCECLLEGINDIF